MVITRFCPTVDGHLHHGNAYTAILNQEFARRHGGRFLVEIDDLSMPWVQRDDLEGILDDLEWLGISSRTDVSMRSHNNGIFLEMLSRLEHEGKIRIDRTIKGCCLTKLEIMRDGNLIPARRICASSNAPGVVGSLGFAANPQHLLPEHSIDFIRESGGMLWETYWCSHPRDKEPWLELELPREAMLDSLRLSWRSPKPREVDVLLKRTGRAWQQVGSIRHRAERHPSWWGSFVVPSTDDDVVILPPNQPSSCSKIRLHIRGLQPMEEYTVIDQGTIACYDTCLGEVPVETEVEFRYFAWPASDIVLGTTHVVRGAELAPTLARYAQLMRLMNQPFPVFCHIPPLVDGEGDKLAKSLHNAPRITQQLQAEGISPTQARQWIIENAYTNVSNPTPLHSFQVQLQLLDSTVGIQGSQVPLARREESRC